MRRFSKNAAAPAVVTAIIARVFYGLAIDSPDVHNGAWLSVLIGAAASLLPLYLLKHILSQGESGSVESRTRWLCLPLSILLALDAAEAIECTAVSAGYVAFSHVATWLLVLPLLAVGLRSSMLGGNAIGYASIILARLVPPLLLTVILLQLPYFRLYWIAPILGFGMRGIIEAGLRTGAWITLIYASAMILNQSDSDASSELKPARDIAIAAGSALMLVTLRLLMAPAMDAGAMRRIHQLDALLTNGRAPLYCQLPMITLWFIGMLNLICYECFAVGALLKRCFPRADSRLLSALGPVLAALPALSAGGAGAITKWMRGDVVYSVLLAGIVVCAALTSRKGGKRSCESSG